MNKVRQIEKIALPWAMLLIVVLALFRLVPHAPNFTPLAAMALLGGIWIKDFRLALLLPLIAMGLSDLFLGLHSSLPAVYMAFLITGMIGRGIAANVNAVKMTAGAVISAVLFYLITNFAAWLQHDMYPHNISGLLQAYVAGIPFFRNTLISTILFSLIGYACMRGVGYIKSVKVPRALD